MFKHILIATDGSPIAGKAAKAGVALASRLGAKITAYSAVEALIAPALEGYALDPKTMEKFDEDARQLATKRATDICKLAQSAGVPCEPYVTRGSTTHQGIIEAAKKRKCDVIVMGSHGRRGVSKLIMGSVTQRVLAYTRLPVLVLR